MSAARKADDALLVTIRRLGSPGECWEGQLIANRILYLHVGTHKTGTTSFQHFLMDRRDGLADHGLAVFPGRYPRRVGPPQEVGNAWLLADAFLRRDLMSTMRLKAAQGRCGPLQGWSEKARLEKFLAEATQFGVVVSAEAFCLLRTNPEATHLKNYLTRLDCDVVPILVTRNAESWRASHNNQLVRMHYYGPEVDGLPDTRRVDGNWYYDAQAIAAFWSDIGPLVQIDYDGVMAGEGSIIPAMMAALGLPDFGAGVDYRLNARRPYPGTTPA